MGPSAILRHYRLMALGVCLLSSAIPLQAQSLEELDRLSDISADEERGIAAAREQAQRMELLEALATLERVMAAHPRSLNARMLHAYYLCAIDDLQGGRVEIDNMDEDDFGRDNIAELRQRCPAASSEVGRIRANSADNENPGKPGARRPETMPQENPNYYAPDDAKSLTGDIERFVKSRSVERGAEQ